MKENLLPGAVIARAGSSAQTKTGEWRATRPERHEKLAPCRNGCPIGNQIPKVLHLLRRGKMKEATSLLLETNPFPAITGRVCYHPCEEKCNRKEFDEPVAIHLLERFIGDSIQNMPDVSVPNEPEVAIIGSGPAGLSCAYHLAKLGHASIVFEKLPTIGGMLGVIPEYRLPKEVLAGEVSRLKEMGVKFVTNTAIKSLSELKAFKAIFIAVGASKGVRLGIPGEDGKGVYQGIDFLRSLKLGNAPKLGKRCLVIGGGNTAIDCARSARRLGTQVTILYRRSREEMPALPEEVEEALTEGVKIEFLVAPKEVILKDGKVAGLQCIRMKLGPPDESGRPKPIPIEGSEFEIAADSIVVAIGQQPDLSFLPAEIALKKNKILCDEWGRTNVKGVFAGGDAVYGIPERVADAIASGRKAAIAIDFFLKGQEPKPSPPLPEVSFKELNLAYFTHRPRVKPPPISLDLRLNSFAEVWRGLDEDEARNEAERCFSCGTCNECDNCWLYCPEMAVKKKDGEYEIDYDFCKGCGICANECPRRVIDLVPEGTK
jgi:2-oxoacid:acceptor oxidoreductase delta subunit (pyruvate/2-ketoisovalerate family)